MLPVAANCIHPRLLLLCKSQTVSDQHSVDSELPSDHDAEPDSDAAGKTTECSQMSRSCKPFPFRRLFILGSIVATLIFLVQWFAPQFDYQNANLLTMVLSLALVIYLLVLLQRFATARGKRLLVPGAVLAAVGAAFALFQFEGFNGEMLPQVSWRFSSPENGRLQETPLASDQAASESGSADNPESTALQNSHQFLGPNRTGVIDQREFRVPSSAADTKVLWDQPIGEGWASFAVWQDRAVTLEQREESECVTCYRLSDGQLLWIDQHEARHENPLGGIGPRTTPAIIDGRVYAMGAMGFLRVLDVTTGERIWTKDMLAQSGWTPLEFAAAAPWGNAQSPLVIESLGMVVVGMGGPVDESSADANGMTDTPKSLIAFDWKTGEVQWKAGRDQFSYASPMLFSLDGQEQIVSVNEKTVTGHLAKTGDQLWSFSWPGSTNAGANCASAIRSSPNRFVVGKGYGGGSAMAEVTKDENGDWNAETMWSSSRVLKTKFNHTCVRGETGYAISNGTLQAANLQDGTSLWNQPRRERFGQGQVVLVEDTLVCQSESGDVAFVAAQPDQYKELGRLNALQSKTWNIPTVAGRHLIVRNDRRAVCFLLEKRN